MIKNKEQSLNYIKKILYCSAALQERKSITHDYRYKY